MCMALIYLPSASLLIGYSYLIIVKLSEQEKYITNTTLCIFASLLLSPEASMRRKTTYSVTTLNNSDRVFTLLISYAADLVIIVPAVHGFSNMRCLVTRTIITKFP